jgi:protoporphyrinogen oxidase
MTIQTKEIIVLGAGPSGLAVAHALINHGFARNSILVLEKEETAGGLCRSATVDGAALDIGGGHFLDVRRQQVLNFLFRFMPREEWCSHDRVSKIRLHGREVDHPLEANLWQLPIDIQADYLESIARAGCVRQEPMPESFEDWIRWKLGDCIAQDYMLPYNRKIWSMEPNALGTYWLHKLPDVSFRESLVGCLQGRALGTLPAHGTFLYPHHTGYGEVWRRMGDALGQSLITGCAVDDIDISSLTVNGRWRAKTIISTIPWTLWPQFADLPAEIVPFIGSLRNAPIDVDYVPDTLDSDAHWTYEPDERISYHRILLRANFAAGSRGYWTETNAARSPAATGTRFHNAYAYPINAIGKPEAIARILDWARSCNILGLGRWGRWEHMNSDVAVSEALQMGFDLRSTAAQ